jgi:formylglycine-generating enzyme required for sulfatase activity
MPWIEADKTMNWYDARKYCEEKGMRLPTVAKLREMCKNECSGDKYEKERCDKWYWSSENCAPDTTCAMLVGFSSGGVSRNDKTASHYVRCVRAGP